MLYGDRLLCMAVPDHSEVLHPLLNSRSPVFLPALDYLRLTIVCRCPLGQAGNGLHVAPDGREPVVRKIEMMKRTY